MIKFKANMQLITFKQYNAKSFKAKIPTLLSEITIGQLIDIESLGDDKDLNLKSLAIFCNLPITALKNVSNSTDYFEQIKSLEYKLQYEFDLNKKPSHVVIKNKRIKVLGNLSVQPVGAFMDARDLIADTINAYTQNNSENWENNLAPKMETCAMLLAYYFYCPVTGLPYDTNKAEELIHEIKKLPITDAIPIARYFFLSYPDLLKPKLTFWEAVRLIWKKKLASKILKNLAISIP